MENKQARHIYLKVYLIHTKNMTSEKILHLKIKSLHILGVYTNGSKCFNHSNDRISIRFQCIIHQHNKNNY